ncbi:MAG: diphthine synthase [Candidatus Woesearchaeota archaeon]
MTLTLIGLGLDPNDLSIRARDAIAASDVVLLETYTSYAAISMEELVSIVDTEITPLTRQMVEHNDIVLERARTQRTALLVFGDPLAATTHLELVLRARAEGIGTNIIHAPSIFSAIGESGLELYRFGLTASLVYPRRNWLPERARDVIALNRSIKAHSLVLLDIITGDEELALLDRDHEAFAGLDRSRIEHEAVSLAGEPQLLMSPNEAIALLVFQKVVEPSDPLIVCSRLGTGSGIVSRGSVGELLARSFGLGPHAIVIPGELHFLESEPSSANGSESS